MNELQTLDYRVDVTESDGKVSIDIRIEGTPHVPVSLEMSFRSVGVLKGVTADKTWTMLTFWRAGWVSTPRVGMLLHLVLGSLSTSGQKSEGHSLPKQAGDSVYLTGYTPFRPTLDLG